MNALVHGGGVWCLELVIWSRSVEDRRVSTVGSDCIVLGFVSNRPRQLVVVKYCNLNSAIVGVVISLLWQVVIRRRVHDVANSVLSGSTRFFE